MFQKQTKLLAYCMVTTFTYLTVVVQKRNSKWRPLPSWIYFRWLFWHTSDFPLLISTTTQNFMPISQSAADLGNFSNFKMAAVRHLRFSKIWFLINEWPWAADFPSRYQIWCKKVDLRPNYDPKTKFKIAAVVILNLLPAVTFDIRLTLHCWSQPPHKISCQYLNRLLTYGHWRRKLLGRAGRGPPTFWPLWAAHSLGPPTFNHMKT